MRALLLALALAGCAPPEFYFPEATELECGKVEQAEYTNDSTRYCVRVAAIDGALVKHRGTDGCDAWMTCIILAPGESLIQGAPMGTSGTIVAEELECSETPPCE